MGLRHRLIFPAAAKIFAMSAEEALLGHQLENRPKDVATDIAMMKYTKHGENTQPTRKRKREGKMNDKVIDITHKIQDMQVARILAMSDDEIMVNAIREYGSPENARKAAEKIRQGINNAIKQWGIPATDAQQKEEDRR